MTAKDKGILKMKKFEIIIPHRRLDDVSQILKGINVGGMSHYEIEGRGKVKAEPVAIGREYCSVHSGVYS